LIRLALLNRAPAVEFGYLTASARWAERDLAALYHSV